MIPNECRKSTNDTIDTNQYSNDKDKNKEDDVILDKLTLAKHRILFQFTSI